MNNLFHKILQLCFKLEKKGYQCFYWYHGHTKQIDVYIHKGAWDRTPRIISETVYKTSSSQVLENLIKELETLLKQN